MKLNKVSKLKIVTALAILPILVSCYAQGAEAVAEGYFADEQPGVQYYSPGHTSNEHYYAYADHGELPVESIREDLYGQQFDSNREDLTYQLFDDAEKNISHQLLFCRHDYGRRYVRVVSEGIVALIDNYYIYNNFSYDFGLKPFSEEFPRESGAIFSYEEFDFYDLQQRLFQASYNLRIHYTLESEIDRVVKYNLAMDGVIRVCPEFELLWRVRFLNTHIFDRFVEENVNIEIIYCDIPDIIDSRGLNSGPIWVVHNHWFDICFFLYPFVPYCFEHNIHIWLVEFTDTHRTIWDMRTVTETGCGRIWPT